MESVPRGNYAQELGFKLFPQQLLVLSNSSRPTIYLNYGAADLYCKFIEISDT